MHKTYQNQLYPTKRRASKVEQSQDICREGYNDTLAYRKNLYETKGESVLLYETNNLITKQNTF
ncbi:helix-turn-helix domain-containing protein [Methanoculleus sp.]|uniref:helix-turn-helix domain-containing protein n=1 Tax=Methanoculleus sp. TaxID=90427 RepID=UPI003458DF24